jgi:hypothetical protein
MRTDMRTYIFGVGGAVALTYPFYNVIQSFREWDHYHDPVSQLPHHRFWTWAKMNRSPQYPDGKCLAGNFHTRKDMDSIFLKCDRPLIDEKIAKYRGMWHGIGNEPNYSDIKPEDYAYQFHMYHSYIKGNDSEAKLMVGGITLPVPWIEWLEQVLQSYKLQFGVKMPVDIWDIHPYANGWPDGKEAATRGIAYISEFRKFLNSNKYRHTPIVLGEFSDAAGSQPVEQLSIYAKVMGKWLMNNATNKKIIAIYWWGSQVSAMGTAGIFDKYTITPVGDYYVAYCGATWFVGKGVEDESRLRGSFYNPFSSLKEAKINPETRDGKIVELL